MTLPTTLPAIVEALRNAGATEEMIAAAVKAGGELQNPPPRQRGRRRQYADAAARQRAWRRRNEIRYENQPSASPRNEIPVERPADAGRNRFHLVSTEAIRGRLLDAAPARIDPLADVEPISGLLEQGCDLDLDVLPVVATWVSDLPRPLKNWGAPWLVREILAAREQRLASHRVEATPPARRTPAIEWDEFVGGYRAGLIEWNAARLGPKPGEPGCRAPAEVLREHGYCRAR
jgi:hypothetical protein